MITIEQPISSNYDLTLALLGRNYDISTPAFIDEFLADNNEIINTKCHIKDGMFFVKIYTQELVFISKSRDHLAFCFGEYLLYKQRKESLNKIMDNKELLLSMDMTYKAN